MQFDRETAEFIHRIWRYILDGDFPEFVEDFFKEHPEHYELIDDEYNVIEEEFGECLD